LRQLNLFLTQLNLSKLDAVVGNGRRVKKARSVGERMEWQFQQSAANRVAYLDAHSPDEWAHLIRKLRWTGLEDEAKRLEKVVSTLPAEQRAGVSSLDHSAPIESNRAP
jgi:hypothetical protein